MRIAPLLTLMLTAALLLGCEPSAEPTTSSEPVENPAVDPAPPLDATLAPEPVDPSASPLDTLDPTTATEPEASTELVEAEAGVGKPGQSLEPGNMITEPARAFFSARQNLVFIQVEQALQLYKATNGSVPQSTEAFMEQVIQPNSIRLPELRSGHRYVFDPESEKLLVERPQLE